MSPKKAWTKPQVKELELTEALDPSGGFSDQQRSALKRLKAGK